MKTHHFVASLLVLTIAPPTLSAAPQGSIQPSHDPNTWVTRGEPEWAESFGGIRVFTDPSLDAQMGFTIPTEVQEVLVTGGQQVAKGDLLIRARDGEAVAAEMIQRLRAESELPIESAKIDLTVLDIEFQRKDAAFRKDSASPLERDQAKARRDRAQINLDIAKMQFAEQKLLLMRARGELDRFRLHAPFDGLIESVSVDPGQAVTQSQPVLRIVNIDRLKSRVPTPTRRVMESALKPGDPAWLVMDLAGDPRVLLGHVTAVSPVADFPTQTTNVWIEIDNPDHHPAGLTAWVRFTRPTGEWAERIVSSNPIAPVREAPVSPVVGAAKTADANR